MRICRKVKRAAQSPVEFLPKGCYGRAPLQSHGLEVFVLVLVLDRDSRSSGVTSCFGSLVAHYQTQFLGRDLSGAHPPEIDKELAGNGYDRLPFERPIGSTQHRIPLLYGLILGLKLHKAPSHLDQQHPDARVADFGD
jgi:hypothetical protein